MILIKLIEQQLMQKANKRILSFTNIFNTFANILKYLKLFWTICKYFKPFQNIYKKSANFSNRKYHKAILIKTTSFAKISNNFKEFKTKVFLTLLQIGCLIWRRSGWWPRPTCTSFEGHHEQLKLLLRLERFSSTLCSQKKKGFLNCNIL